MARLASLAVLVALLAASAAQASTPAKYKAEVSFICRIHGPSMQRAKEHYATWGEMHSLVLKVIGVNGSITSVPVPSELDKQMSPVLGQLAWVTSYAHHALTALMNQNETVALIHIKQMFHAEKTLDELFDAEGLRECGSAF